MVSLKMKSFFLGIVLTSFTWVVIIFLYMKVAIDSSPPPKWKLQPRVDALAGYQKVIKAAHKEQMLKSNNVFKMDNFPPKELNLIDSDERNFHKFDVGRFKVVPNISHSMKLGIIRSPKDQKVKDEGYKRHAFNMLISDRIGYHRTIPYTAHSLCQRQIYSPSLPKASVIICFFNEAWSTLVRMVYSILKRTPTHLLHEILLVDDFSDDTSYLDKMERFFTNQTFFNQEIRMKFLRTPKRAGLIRARVFGARKATGEVLVFLDSHCEVNELWLEPLLDRIQENRTTVVCPIIDIINADTFEYTSSPMVRGGFNWGLHFKWDSVPPSHFRLKQDFTKPIMSPTMAGGLFAIEKNYFHELGEYDEGMDIWGGENLEISFRIWMCGGRLEILPCSRVGHIFRRRRPYGSPDGTDTLTYNSLRVAHVWMDEYKKYFFKLRPDAEKKHYGDISSRLDLKNQLKCHPFEWYMKNVYPELVPPNASDVKNSSVLSRFVPKQSPEVLHKFQLQLGGTNLCVQCEDDVTTKGSLLIFEKCAQIKKQIWYETTKHELRLAQLLCLDAGEQYPRLSKCHEMGGSQDWRHASMEESPFYNSAAGLCLGSKTRKKGQYLLMDLCSSKISRNFTMVVL